MTKIRKKRSIAWGLTRRKGERKKLRTRGWWDTEKELENLTLKTKIIKNDSMDREVIPNDP